MTRMVYIAGICAILAAGVVLVFCVCHWEISDLHVISLLAEPGVVEVFNAQVSQRQADIDGQLSPLVVQAQILAAYLDPPPSSSPRSPVPALQERREVTKTASPLVRRERKDMIPVVEPKISSMKFSVLATSYYAAEPGKSMALMAEPGGKAGSERWVREGHKLGHFVVHEIRQGVVVFRQGQDLREVAVDRAQGLKGLVTNVHSPLMREIGDTTVEKPRPQRNRKDRDKGNPLDKEARAVSRASGS